MKEQPSAKPIRVPAWIPPICINCGHPTYTGGLHIIVSTNEHVATLLHYQKGCKK